MGKSYGGALVVVDSFRRRICSDDDGEGAYAKGQLKSGHDVGGCWENIDTGRAQAYE